MKKLILSALILVSCLTFKNASAQVRLSLGVNISNQPDWGPVGYDHADYYYMPDIDTYYDVNSHQYIYFDAGQWRRHTTLPGRYASYDMYHGYKAVVNERTPWLRNNVYRTRYASYRGRHDQVVIRNSQDAKYRAHWHAQAVKERNHDLKVRDHQLDHRAHQIKKVEHNQRAHDKRQREKDEHR